MLAIAILCLFFSQSTMAESYQSASGKKMVSGLSNVVTGVAELPKNIIISTKYHGVPYGMTVGVATGVMHTVGRTVIGALDLITFMIPTGPSISPPYIWEDFSTETSYGSHF